MIQDIFPHVYHNVFTVPQPTQDSVVFLCRDNEIQLRHTGDSIDFPSYGELELPADSLTYLFAIDNTAYFLAGEEAAADCVRKTAQHGFCFDSVRSLRNAMPKHTAFAGLTAYHLFSWYRDNRFCGRCAAPMVPGDRERNLVCSACGSVIYPKIAPAVIAAVTDGDRLLLTRYARGEYRREALVAGFTEIGETAEETVVREVFEETGIRVKNVTYYKSQPWALSGSLLLGFFAELAGDDRVTIQEDELSEAFWVPRGSLEAHDEDFSLTNEMILAFIRGNYPGSGRE